jgi:hypothetical protein
VPVLRNPTTGQVINVGEDEVGHAVIQGYEPVSLGEAAQTTAAPAPQDQSGFVGGVNALATGTLSGLTAGLSDVALSGLLDPGQLERLNAAREQHEGLTTGGQLAGALAPSLLGAGPASLLARSPAGLVSRAGAGISGLAENAGVAGRIAAHLGAGAAEGALQNAGAYIGETALGDRDLAADAFVGAMGQGALWGAGGAAAFGLAGEALGKARALLGASEGDIAARRLFPSQEINVKAVEDAHAAASKELGEALADGETLEHRAQQTIVDQRNLALATDPEFARKVAELSASPADDLEGLLFSIKTPEVSPEGASLGRFDPELESLLHGLDIPDVGEAGGRIDKRPPITTEVINGSGGGSDIGEGLARARQLDETRVGRRRPPQDVWPPAGPESAPSASPPPSPEPGTPLGDLLERSSQVGGETRVGRRPAQIQEPFPGSDAAPPKREPPSPPPRDEFASPAMTGSIPHVNSEATNVRLKAMPRILETRDALRQTFERYGDGSGPQYDPYIQEGVRHAYRAAADAYGMARKAEGMWEDHLSFGDDPKVGVQGGRVVSGGADGEHWSDGTGRTRLIILQPKYRELLHEHSTLSEENLRVLGDFAARGDPDAERVLRAYHVMSHENIHGYGPTIPWKHKGQPDAEYRQGLHERAAVEELTTELAARRLTRDLHGLERGRSLPAVDAYHTLVGKFGSEINSILPTRTPAEIYAAMQQAALDFKSLSGEYPAFAAAHRYSGLVADRLGLTKKARTNLVLGLRDVYERAGAYLSEGADEIGAGSSAISVKRAGLKYDVTMPDGTTTRMDRNELHDFAESMMPDGFTTGGHIGVGSTIKAGLPSTFDEVVPGSLYVAKPHEFVQRGVIGDELMPGNIDNIKKAWAEGKRLRPIDVDITPDGKLYVEDGNHRLQAAASTDRTVVVSVRQRKPPGWEPKVNAIDITDRLKSVLPDGPYQEAKLKVPAGAVGSTSGHGDLMSQLEGTRDRLNGGEELGSISATSRRSRSEQIDAELAKSNPTVAKLRDAMAELREARTEVQRFLTKADVQNYAASLRPEGDGWRMSVPEGEGNAVLQRGRQFEWRGSELERANAEFRINNKVKPEERIAAGRAVDDMMERRGMTHEERIAHALKQKPADVSEDIVHAAQAISRYEAAQAGMAELAQTLGIQVPSGTLARAEGFRAAQSHAEQATQQATAIGAQRMSEAAGHAAMGGTMPGVRAAADRTVRDPSMGARLKGEFSSDARTVRETTPRGEFDIADKTYREPGLAGSIAADHAAGGVAPGGKRTGVGGHLANAGAIYEALRMMGVPLPDPHNIPVIGPLLSVYLKARVIGKTFGRFGGRVADTAETAVARAAAETKQRMFAAVDAILHGASKAAKAAAPVAGGAAAILSHRLFDTGVPVDRAAAKQARKSGAGDIAELYQLRAEELAQAAQPGAIRQAIMARIRTADPTIANAIADSFERQVEFLLDKMPKPLEHPGLLPGSVAYTPNRAEMTKWTRYVQAATDPASVLEQVAAGGIVTPEAAEALQVVYPTLFAAAQKRLLEQASDVEHPIPYGRLKQASLLFGLPLGGTMTPEYAAWAQQGYVAPPPPAPPGPSSLHAPVSIAQMTQGPRP